MTEGQASQSAPTLALKSPMMKSASLLGTQRTMESIYYRNKMSKQGRVFNNIVRERFLLSINQVTVCSCSGVSSLKNSDNDNETDTDSKDL